MPALNRWTSRRTGLLAAILLIVLILGGLFIVVASGAEDRRVDGRDVTIDPSATGSTGTRSSSTGDLGGGSGAGPSTTLPRRLGPDDPDRPVSSDDPPLSPGPAQPPPDDGIDSFEDCVAAGYPVAESYPEQCFTPDGRSFRRVIS